MKRESEKTKTIRVIEKESIELEEGRHKFVCIYLKKENEKEAETLREEEITVISMNKEYHKEIIATLLSKLFKREVTVDDKVMMNKSGCLKGNIYENGCEILIFGGGLLEYDKNKKTIQVFDKSGSYGKYEEIAVNVLRRVLPDYKISAE